MEVPLRASIGDLEKAFYENHQEVYRFAFAEPVMITDLILNAYGSKPKAMLEKPSTQAVEAGDALSEMRPVWFADRFVDTPVFRREDVPAGSHFQAPVIFEELGSTTVVQPGWAAEVDGMGNLVLEKKESP
jgi:N-methylhydantoinase A